MQNTRYKIRATRHGFTLVELLVALIVSSVILAAVATIAFAMSSANDATDDTRSKQAQVRYTALRVSDLIRHCKLICGTPGYDLAIWRTDKNGDGKININEITFIEKGSDANYLKLCEFPSSDTSEVTLSQIETLSPVGYSVRRVTLIPQCGNVEFMVDAEPPMTKFLSISFDLDENNVVRHYQINNALRGWSGNLLSSDWQSIVSDDD